MPPLILSAWIASELVFCLACWSIWVVFRIGDSLSEPGFGSIIRSCRNSAPRAVRQAFEVRDKLAPLAQRETAVRRNVAVRVTNVKNKVLQMGVVSLSGA